MKKHLSATRLTITAVALATIALSAFTMFATPVVQVRDYPHDPSVVVVAWQPSESNWGLRSSVRRDGRLENDHWFYVSTIYLGNIATPRFVNMFEPKTRNVEAISNPNDTHFCNESNVCSPKAYMAARIPDNILRTHPDSIVLRFPSSRASDGVVDVTIRRDLIDPYLATVDSVVASFKKP